MKAPVNPATLQAEYALSTAPLLRGILTVLTDIHCKDMSNGERAQYLEKLRHEMNHFHDDLLDASKA